MAARPDENLDDRLGAEAGVPSRRLYGARPRDLSADKQLAGAAR
ncbi:hypothetical protein ACFY2N_27790 [Streptomyces rubiginosohelvolus]